MLHLLSVAISSEVAHSTITFELDSVVEVSDAGVSNLRLVCVVQAGKLKNRAGIGVLRQRLRRPTPILELVLLSCFHLPVLAAVGLAQVFLFQFLRFVQVAQALVIDRDYLAVV